MDTLLGQPMSDAFSYLSRATTTEAMEAALRQRAEMYNIVKAAEAGLQGDPGQYRDWVVPRPAYQPRSVWSLSGTLSCLLSFVAVWVWSVAYSYALPRRAAVCGRVGAVVA